MIQRESERACGAMSQIIDMELDERTPDELAGAYRALCSMVLIRTAILLGRSTKSLRNRKLEVIQKRTAREWLDGGRGVLSFDAACEAFDVDCEWAKAKILDHASSGEGGTINRRKAPRTHMVFGRSSNARPPVDHRQTAAASRVVARYPTGHCGIDLRTRA